MNPIVSLFWFGGRIGRTTFLVRLAALVAIALAIKAAYPEAIGEQDDPFIAALQAVGFYAYFWCVWANSAKRWHDVDRSALFTALMIVPIVGIALDLALNALIDGTPGPNRFGEPPR
ncbi:MAG TPA: DUF805 domain-containing protein [Rhodanobacteraceae bacterium]|nr:DUF805 domain-containing protein [Rhodanobacteraceae bacterium]